VEVCESIEAVETVDLDRGECEWVAGRSCGFAYRDSHFKGPWANRRVITRVRFRLQKAFTPRLDYAGLASALAGIESPTARQVADAVIAIRRSKLPDPAVLGNAGSFFKNPIVDRALADGLKASHPAMPQWAVDESRVKLSAAWLIEQSGFKGCRQGDAGISAQHALVMVNHGRASGAELWALAQTVREGVRSRFGVALEHEPQALYAEPNSGALKKETTLINGEYRRLIEVAPFVAIASAGPEGLDCSPRGDLGAVATVPNERTVVIADWRGNNRLDTLRNIVRDGRVGLLFLIPGIRETLRVNGNAVVSVDPDLLARMARDGKAPNSAIVVAVEAVYFQCARALTRSRLWDASLHRSPSDLPTAGQLIRSVDDGFDAESYDTELKERQRRTLY
ncbi:unnamed protein product, partial [Cyprideis torosa]